MLNFAQLLSYKAPEPRRVAPARGGRWKWIAVGKSLPDADTTVLVFAAQATEPVWLGYLDGETWRSIDGAPLPGVSHWQELPDGPEVPA